MTATVTAAEQPTRRRWYQPNATVIAVGVVGLIVGVIVGIESLKRPAPAPMGDGDVAVVMCQSFIENRLEAPSTAVFSDVVYSGGPPRWTVTGVVDAKSAAGYPLRSVFRCVVIDNTDNGSGIWHLEYLTGDDATTSPIWDEVVGGRVRAAGYFHAGWVLSMSSSGRLQTGPSPWYRQPLDG